MKRALGLPVVIAAVIASAGMPASAASNAGGLAQAGHVRAHQTSAQLARVTRGDGRAGLSSHAFSLLSRCLISFFWAASGSFESLAVGRTHFVIPEAAMPFIGRGLDPALFDTGALAAVESGGRIPLQIRYSGGIPHLPGVTITGHQHGIAAGYLTHDSARVLVAALRHQFLADRARGSFGQDGMFAGGVSLGLAGARTPAPRPPAAFPMGTLTVIGTDLAGKPARVGLVQLFNVDNTGRLDVLGSEFQLFYKGVAKYSAPLGHYFALISFFDVGPDNTEDLRVVTLPQFSVGRATTVRVSERAADSLVTMVPPRPAISVITEAFMDRSGAAGPPVGVEWATAVNDRLFLNPTSRKPSAGNMTETTARMLTSPPGASGTPYSYFLAHISHGLIPRQRFVITARNLATVHSVYFAATPSISGQGASPVIALDQQACIGLELFQLPLTLPQARISYFSAGQPPLAWQQAYSEGVGLDTGGQEGIRAYRAGQQVTETWNAYPLHPAPGVVLPGTSAQVPQMASASRNGNVLRLDWFPFSDSVPGHEGGAFFEPTTKIGWTIDQNGRRVASGHENGWETFYGDFQAKAVLSPGPSTVSFTFNATEPASLFPLSAASHTVWTWRSRHEAGSTLPRQWSCTRVFVQRFPPTRSCAVEPLMTLRYALTGLALNGSTQPGRQVLAIAAAHLPLVRPIPVTRASVAVSFDRGKTWQQASLTGSDGHYTAVFNAPAGVDVTLRTRASDAARGTITETITNAYRVAAAAIASGAGAVGLRSGAGTTAAASPAGGYRAACGPAGLTQAQCFALYAPQTRVNAAIAAQAAGERVPASATRPGGWGARAIESAYRLPAGRHSRETVGIVDALSAPHLAADLAVYRKEYGLPPCTVANGCLRIVNQSGKPSPLPKADPEGWGVEETLDVSMVSAACPHCRILLVEARTPAVSDLAAAEDTAARLGAAVISNSYGARESGLSQTLARFYHHPGHVIVASSGDSGFTAAIFPANLRAVTAVGGTELARARNARGWTEKVWHVDPGASGSGCSAYVAKPAWQHDGHCPGRTIADVSAVAWRVAMYDSSIPRIEGGPWFLVGGTSASAPIIAGMYGLAGNATTVRPGSEYRQPGAFFDIVTGNNDWINNTGGATCGSDYLCAAKIIYDAPTGLGTPNGIGAF